MKKKFFVVLIGVSIAAATAHAGMWHVDNKGQLREWSGSTDPIRTPPSGCGQIYSVEQKNNDKTDTEIELAIQEDLKILEEHRKKKAMKKDLAEKEKDKEGEK